MPVNTCNVTIDAKICSQKVIHSILIIIIPTTTILQYYDNKCVVVTRRAPVNIVMRKAFVVSGV